jgi:radical SAM protein with 4Fe4S-binding SPASM domain
MRRVFPTSPVKTSWLVKSIEEEPMPVTRRAVRSMHHDASDRPFIVIWEVTRACRLVCTHCRADALRTFRGVPGVFDGTLEAARTVREVGLRLQINTTVTRGNVLELPAMLKSVLDLGAAMWSVFFLVPTGRGKLLEPLTAVEEEEVLHWLHDVSNLIAIKTTEAPHYRRIAIQRAGVEVLDDVFPVGPLRAQLRQDTTRLLTGREPSRRPRPPVDVNSGRGFAFVDHVGAVYPSGFLPAVVGSVRDQSFPEIYRSSELRKALRNPDAFGGRCGRCEFRTVCGGSRSHAFATTGDPLAQDPSCLYQPLPGRGTCLTGEMS